MRKIKENPPFQNDIETIIDKVGLSTLAALVYGICYEKADHVRENWQDARLAKEWEKAADIFENAQSKIDRLAL